MNRCIFPLVTSSLLLVSLACGDEIEKPASEVASNKSEAPDWKAKHPLLGEIPIKLPEFRDVSSSESTVGADKINSIFISAETESVDFEAVAKELTVEMESKGFVVSRNQVEANGRISMIMLTSKNEGTKHELNVVLTPTPDPEHVGVLLTIAFHDSKDFEG